MPKRLAHETSPYLLRHAGKPVDWRQCGRPSRWRVSEIRSQLPHCGPRLTGLAAEGAASLMPAVPVRDRGAVVRQAARLR